MDSKLRCYRSTCNGTLRYVDTSDCLYRCSQCGGTVSKGPLRELARDSGPVAQLADKLLANRV